MNKHQTLLQYVFTQSDSKKLRPIKTKNIQKKLKIFESDLKESYLLVVTILSLTLWILDIKYTGSDIVLFFALGVLALPLFIRMNNIKSVTAEKLNRLESPSLDEARRTLQALMKEQGFLLEGQYYAAINLEEEKKESAIKEKWGIK